MLNNWQLATLRKTKLHFVDSTVVLQVIIIFNYMECVYSITRKFYGTVLSFIKYRF